MIRKSRASCPGNFIWCPPSAHRLQALCTHGRRKTTLTGDTNPAFPRSPAPVLYLDRAVWSITIFNSPTKIQPKGKVLCYNIKAHAATSCAAKAWEQTYSSVDGRAGIAFTARLLVNPAVHTGPQLLSSSAQAPQTGDSFWDGEQACENLVPIGSVEAGKISWRFSQGEVFAHLFGHNLISYPNKVVKCLPLKM